MRKVLALCLALPFLVAAYAPQAKASTTEETANNLAKISAKTGALRKPSPEQQNWIRNSIAKKTTGSQYLALLNGNGWNSSGGGGGYACFRNHAEAKEALDKTGRMKRAMIPRITSLVPFDYFHLATTDFDIKSEEMNGNEPKFHAILPGESTDEYSQRVVSERFTKVAPLFAETLLATLKKLAFTNWQPVRANGLPYFPDLDEAPSDAVQYKSIVMGEGRSHDPCVYVQLAIRFAGKNAPTQIIYDADLIDTMRALSKSETEFKQMLAVLNLHESLYFMVTRTSPYNGQGVMDQIKDLLLNEFDEEYFRYSYFPRGRSLGRFLSLALAKDYDALLLEDAKKDPTLAPREELFRAWNKHVMEAEKPEWKLNKTGDSSIAFFGWTGLEYPRLGALLTDPAARAIISPADAMAAALVTISLNGAIPSPESAFTRRSGVDVKQACAYFGNFTDGKLLTHIKSMKDSAYPFLDINSSPEGERDLLALIQRFCSPTGKDQTADKELP